MVYQTYLMPPPICAFTFPREHFWNKTFSILIHLRFWEDSNIKEANNAKQMRLFTSRRKSHVPLQFLLSGRWNLLPHRKSGSDLRVPVVAVVASLCWVPQGSVSLWADSLWELAAYTLAVTLLLQHLKNSTVLVQVLTLKTLVSIAVQEP